MAKLLPYLDLLPLGLVIALTMYFTVEVPSSDDWDLVPILKEMHEGTLDWKTLDAPYAGHKMPVSYLVMGGIAWITHWDSYIFRLTNILLLWIAWLAIRPFALRAGLLLETAVFYWSWNQWAEWLWTWMISCSLAVVCVLWSLRLLASRHSGRFALGLVLAVLGSFSYGAGLAAWPAAIYLIFFIPRPLLQRVIFGVVLIGTAFLFLQHPAGSGSVTKGGDYWHMPLYFLYSLGSPVGFASKGVAVAASITGLLMLVLSKPSLDPVKTPPFNLSLLLASLAMIALLMIARGGGDSVIGGTDSRYGTMSALFWVAVVLLGNWNGWRRYVLALLIALCVVRSVTRFHDLVAARQRELSGIAGLRQSTPDRMCLKGDQTSPDHFDEDIELMREWHYSLFHTQ